MMCSVSVWSVNGVVSQCVECNSVFSQCVECKWCGQSVCGV